MNSATPGIVNGVYNINVLQVSTQSTLVGVKATPTSGTGAFSPTVPLDNAVSAGGLGTGIFDSTTHSAVFTIGIANGDSVTVTINDASSSDPGTTYTGMVGGVAVSGSTSTYSMDDVVNDVNTAFGSSVLNYQAAGAGGPRVYLYSAGEGTTNGGSVTLSTQSGSFLQAAQLFNAPADQSENLPTATTSTSTLSSLFGGEPTGGYTFSVNGTQMNLAAGATVGDFVSTVNADFTTTGVRAAFVTDEATGKPKLVLQSTNNNSVNLSDVQGGLVTAMQLTSNVTPFTGDGVLLNFNTPTTLGTRDPGAAMGISGTVTVNGVGVSYAATDSMQTLLNNITGSTAGVTATYDSYTDQITLTSKTAGDNSINLSDTGSFLSSYGLASTSSPTFSAGASTLFTVNGGAVRTSETGSLSSAELGVTGLTFNASAVGSTSVTIAPDIITIGNAINQLVTDYNSTQNLVQSYIQTNMTNPSQSGVLAGNSEATQIPNTLRLLMTSAVLDPTSSAFSYRDLADLGVTGNASNNTLTTVNQTDLTNALTNDLTQVSQMFTNLVVTPGQQYPALGIAQSIQNYVTAEATGPNSQIDVRETDINNEVQQMQSQITAINAQVAAEQTALQAEFATYESTVAINKSYEAYFGGSSAAIANSSSSSSSS